MIEIPLSKGAVALIDENDALLANRCWHLSSGGYAQGSRNGKRVLMHREIMQAGPGQEVDHINGCRTDNRRLNLRLCSVAENRMNRVVSINNTSGFKGVSWKRTARKWQAQIMAGGCYQHLGYFDSPSAAALAYDTVAKQLHGAFAHTNERI